MREGFGHRGDLVERAGAEEEPPEAGQLEHAEDPGGAGESAARGRSGVEDREPGCGQAVKDEQAAMIEAPEDEVPGGAVPEAADRHGEHEVAAGFVSAAAVAAEGNVEVIAEPAGKADVPAGPENGGGGGPGGEGGN